MTDLFEQRHRVHDALFDTLTRSPHDYIRTPGFVENDRRMYAAQLTRPLPPEYDLRIGYGGLAVLADRLPWDSAFFGYGVARLHGIYPLEAAGDSDYANALATLLIRCRDAHIRYVIAAVPSEDLSLMRALGDSKFALIETRLHLHRELKDYEPAERFPVRLATADDLPDLRRAAREAVNPYDRFHADPFVAPDVGRLMERWMDASVLDGFADGVLVPDERPTAAFCTLKYYRDQWPAWGYNLAQIPLGACTDSGRGLYTKLMAEALWALKVGGAQHCVYVTQSANRAAVRVCERLGFRYGRSEHVFRVIL